MPSLLKILFITSAISLTALGADPFLGTWKFDREKSKLMTGQDFGAHTTVCESIPDGYSFRSSLVGSPVPFHLDGKNYKTTSSGGFAQRVGADEYSARRLSATVIEATSFRAKKPVGTIRREVSSDGRVLTSTSDGVSPSGEKLHFVLVYEKQ